MSGRESIEMELVPKLTKKINVALILGAYYPEMSGHGNRCYNIAPFLNKSVNFIVITTCKDKKLLYQDNIAGIKVHRVKFTNRDWFFQILMFFRFVSIFLKTRNDFEIMHIFGFSRKSILLVMLGKMFKKKIITEITLLGDDDPASIRRNSMGRMRLGCFFMSDLIVSKSKALTDAFLEFGRSREKLVEIPNGVNTDKFRPLSQLSKIGLKKELGLPEDKKIVLFVGLFSQRKGVDLLIRAWREIRKVTKDSAILVIIGSTDTSYHEINSGFINNVKTVINTEGMGSEIFFIEKSLSVEKYFQSSDLFIFPSRREGFGTVIIEAMATGLPCIISRIEGITNHIIDNNVDGILVRQEEVMDIVEAATKLLNNEALAVDLGINARRKVLERFALENIASQYLEIYSKLIKKPVQ